MIAVNASNGNSSRLPPRGATAGTIVGGLRATRKGGYVRNSVLVIGGGPAGLCASLALAGQGLEVDVIERQAIEALASPAFDGREIALTHASMRLLRTLGVWPHIADGDVAPVRRARIMDGAHAGFEVDGSAFGHEQLGVLVSNHVIRAAAWKAVAMEPRIRVHAGVGVDSVSSNETAATARLDDGRVLQAPLLVAADSRFSESRRSMGVATHLHDFGRSMVVCRMQHEESNEGTAWEWFGDGQTRALLPLGEHLSSVVLTVPDVEAQALLDLPPEAFAAEMTARYEGRLGVMSLASTIHRYPLVATWARRFVGRRFALAGDAAIGMHPVTAHGFNLGLASVEHLAQAAGDGLRRCADPADPAMLARYERRHRVSSAPMFAGTQLLVGVFAGGHAFLRPLRHAAMLAGGRLPVVRRALAANLIDDAPRPGSLARNLRLAFDVLRPRLSAGTSRT